MSTFFEQIFIGSKFDAKGFKQAETALGKLNGTAKKLAGTFGLAFGAAAITSYGKAAVKAFAADEAAALRLNRAVENLGIGFANPAIADYIAKLERSSAVADDILRPAFQGLLTTTGSLTQSQKLLSDAITISRASGIDLATVTEDLGRGYIGVTKGLTKYNTGLSKAELQSMSFNDILGTLLKRSAGAAEDYLDTTAYKMDVLGLATGNASEIIGQGFVDALARAAGGTEATDAQIFLETMAGLFNKVTLAAGTSVGAIPTLAQNLKKLGKDIFMGFAGKQVGVNLAVPAKEKELELTLSQKKQEELLAKFEKDSIRREKERLALKNKQLATDKAKAIIAKGEAALLKGNEVFDMDKIQIAAALTNQAEQLGKATSSTAILQIANDVARLNVKKSILALEDAIASKDEAAIIAATNKLNADLKSLSALTGQSVKLTDIKSILDSLKPVDLISQKNLDDALAKIREMLALLASATGQSTAGVPKSGSLGSGIPAGDYIEPISKSVAAQASIDSILEYADAASARANAFADLLDMQNYADFLSLIDYQKSVGDLGGYSANMNSSAGYGSGNTIIVNTGVGDPNAIAEAIDQVLVNAAQRGTLRGYQAV
jgi:hypothetical protein